jgi:hypothetical protein
VNPEYLRAIEERAYVRGQLDALREQALHNPGLKEAVRLKAWCEFRPGALSIVEGELVAPEGWPDGVDPDLAVERAVDEMFDR